MLDPAIALEVRSRKPGKIAIHMNWRDLLFLHYACPPDSVQPLLPAGLSLDTYPDESGKEMAWIGLVPFQMEGVRPRWMPGVRACSDFLETNVRTYVHVDGNEPGVWFFSLDAANPFACLFARITFHLNYFHAAMSIVKDESQVQYNSCRRTASLMESEATCKIGAALGQAKPGSLEFFLIERYLLYSEKNGSLFKGQVFHAPYELREVESFECSSGLFEVNGLPNLLIVHAIFSDGVDVRGGPIEEV